MPAALPSSGPRARDRSRGRPGEVRADRGSRHRLRCGWAFRVGTRGTGAVLFRTRKDGFGDYVAYPGQTIRVPAGVLIPELEGWVLVFSDPVSTVFRNGREWAVFERGR